MDVSLSAGSTILSTDMLCSLAWDSMYSYSSSLEHDGSGIDTTSVTYNIYRGESEIGFIWGLI